MSSPSTPRSTPASAHASEVAFWRGWIASRGGEWAREFEERLDPSSTLHPDLVALLPADTGRAAEILDVGAGPLTTVGKRCAGREIRITAVDPLAADYDRLLAEFGITPPVRTVAGDAMRSVEQFGRDRFDVVQGRNAIDHTPDAPRAIAEMVGVTRPGGAVFLSHARNEAERQGYDGMHGWNFDGEERGYAGARFVAWSATKRVDISEMLRGEAEVEVRLLPTWINVVIRKVRKAEAK